jgi:hypothetical protein
MTRLTGLLLAVTMSVMLVWLLASCARDGQQKGEPPTAADQQATWWPAAGEEVVCDSLYGLARTE